MRMRAWLLSTTCLCALVAGGGVRAEGLPYGYGGLPDYGRPAVSAPNGKVSVFGGKMDPSLFGVTGAFTVPLGHSFGLQVDGMVGSGRGAAFYGFGGHAFWRDPAKGLLGIYGSHVNWEASTVNASAPGGAVTDVLGADVNKFGVEGAAYLGRWSLEGLAGYQFGSYTGFTGKVMLAVYPTDNFRLDGGFRYLNGVGAIGMVDAEWQPHQGTGLTVFASGSLGENDYSQVLGGVRYYFGDTGKSLIRRHREDDPGVPMPDDLITSTGGTHCPTGTVAYTPIDGATICTAAVPSPR